MQYKKWWMTPQDCPASPQSGVMITLPQQRTTWVLMHGGTRGIIKLQDVFDNYTLSFTELKAKFDILQKHFFKYLQFRSFFLAHLNKSVQQPPFSILETRVANSSVEFNSILRLWKSPTFWCGDARL